MRLFVDTNVLLDVLLNRQPHHIPSAKIWTLSQQRVFQGTISAISLNNLFYIIKKLKTKTLAGQFVDQTLTDFEVAPLTLEILQQARTVKKLDFEDLIQYFSAIHAGCEFFITRNKKDFPKTGITLQTPLEFMKHFESLEES